MSSKRTLVKQKVTYDSAGDGNWQGSDEDFSGKRETKRVSFDSHELSDSDSDAENSLGRINRSSAGPAGDSLDGLFRESSPKVRQRSLESIKGTSGEWQGSRDKFSHREDKEQPRPAPRPRATIAARRSNFEGVSVTASQQSSDEDSDDLSAITWPMKTKETKEVKDRHPVPPPRTSPRQHQEKSSPSDMVSPRPVPRSRPPLSSREGSVKLFQQGSDVHEYERTKHLERDSRVEYEKTETIPDKPMPPLRRKETLEETQENHKRAKIPIVKTSTFEEDGPFLDKNDTADIEQAGNLRHGQLKKVKGRPRISVARSDSSEESEDDSGRINRAGLVGSKKYYEEEKSHDRIFRHPKEESIPPSAPPKPSPRSRVMIDNSMKKHEPSEEGNHVKRPGSAPLLKKSSSHEALPSKVKEGSPTNRKAVSGSKEQGVQKVQLKKSLTPQRPMSAKKGSLMTKLKVQSDITDTFEEHVPSTAENIIEIQDPRGFRKKDASGFDSGGGRSGPLRANQAISTMTRSQHPRETPTDFWTSTKSTIHGGTLTPKKSSSMTNLRGASPDSWSEMGSARGSQHGGLMDTATIRQAVFDEWRTKKSGRLKEQLASKSAEKKKLEEKEKEERERKKMAKRAFESWNEQKQEESKGKNAKKKELMDKELEKEKEKNLKARDAKKYFESWKAKKDEELKEAHLKKKEEQLNKKKKVEEEKQEKSLSAQKVYENWKKNKDEKVKEEVKKKKKEVNDNTMKEEEEKYERSIQCAERYQAWVEKKGKPQRGPPPPALTQRSWCPSGRKSNNCIPEKVGSVIQAPSPNRSRTMSGSYYFKTNKF